MGRGTRCRLVPAAAGFLCIMAATIVPWMARSQEPGEVREPTAHELSEFHRALDRVSETSQRRSSLEEARNDAPFDLVWGLR